MDPKRKAVDEDGPVSRPKFSEIYADVAGVEKAICTPNSWVAVAFIVYIQIAFQQGSSLFRRPANMVHGAMFIKIIFPTLHAICSYFVNIHIHVVTIPSVLS